jgi:hypothetical protein
MKVDKHTKNVIINQLDSYVITGRHGLLDDVLEKLENLLDPEEYSHYDRILEMKLGKKRSKYNMLESKTEIELEPLTI